jgi:hypothetical protein
VHILLHMADGPWWSAAAECSLGQQQLGVPVEARGSTGTMGVGKQSWGQLRRRTEGGAGQQLGEALGSGAVPGAGHSWGGTRVEGGNG